jgi:homocysteine S-methyltransferase
MSDRGQELLQRMKSDIVVGDGAMGTMLCARGIPWSACFEAVNLTQPELVKALHLEYVAAGSDLVETNTFGANRNKLRAAGQAERVQEINAAGVRLAREVVPEGVFVAGAVGPYGRHEPEGEVTDEEKRDAFREHAAVLLEEEADLILLETFSHIQEIGLALRAVKELDSSIPVVCQMAFADALRTAGGSDAIRSLLDLEGQGASVIGGNCGAGPLGLIRVIEQIAQFTEAGISAQPNASFPQYVNGRYIYLSDPAYFADSAERLVASGANLVGGCCGTTPEHIRLVAQRMKGRSPARRRLRALPARPPERPRRREPGTGKIYSPVDRVGTTKVAIVEVKPPRGMALGAVRRAAGELKTAGADAFSLVESSLAQVRMSPFALAHILQEEFGVAAVVHCTCRDRNLMGQQSELAGAAALGIRTILALTGDPASMGDASGSSSVYDINSLGLIQLIANLNQGVNVAGNRVSGSADMVIGAAFDPNVRRLDPAVRRLEKKIRQGAHFVMTQPVFDQDLVREVYRATAHLDVPVFLGVMPLTSYRNAAFLHNEVPGIRIPEEVLERMRRAPEELGKEEGIEIAKGLIDVALEQAPGFYIMPQLEQYGSAVELVTCIKQRAQQPTQARARAKRSSS